MKVIYFSLDYTPHDHRFLSALAETENVVFYIRLQRGPSQTEDRPVPAKIEQVLWAGGQREFRWIDLPKYVMELRRIVKRIQPDLIHAGPIQDAGLLAALTGFHPLLSMSWGFDLLEDAERNAFYRRATRYVLRGADAFASDCEATRERAIAFGMPRERTVVFPWGVDLQQFSPQRSAASHQRETKGFTLLCNRSWEPHYGMDVLARAFVRVAGARPDVNLLLLGEGSLAADIHRILELGGVSNRVQYGGRVPQFDLPRYYHMADLFVSPSHVDGSSVSLLEALACGLPVIVSDIPANREWVTDSVNGWLFPDGDADALAAKILQVLEKRKAMQEMGRAARATAERRADWKKNFPKLLEAYQIAVAHRRNKA
jgi:glycosyltransferase involved in cell wall biosynthesis